MWIQWKERNQAVRWKSLFKKRLVVRSGASLQEVEHRGIYEALGGEVGSFDARQNQAQETPCVCFKNRIQESGKWIRNPFILKYLFVTVLAPFPLICNMIGRFFSPPPLDTSPYTTPPSPSPSPRAM